MELGAKGALAQLVLAAAEGGTPVLQYKHNGCAAPSVPRLIEVVFCLAEQKPAVLDGGETLFSIELWQHRV